MDYFPQAELDESFQPLRFLHDKLGFVPNIFRAQTLLPKVIDAEARLADAVLFQDRALSRNQ